MSFRASWQGHDPSAVPESHGLFAIGLHDVHVAIGRAGIRQPGLPGSGGLRRDHEFVEGPLLIPFFVLQFGLGSVVPLAVITFFIWRGANDRALVVGITASAALVLL